MDSRSLLPRGQVYTCESRCGNDNGRLITFGGQILHFVQDDRRGRRYIQEERRKRLRYDLPNNRFERDRVNRGGSV